MNKETIERFRAEVKLFENAAIKRMEENVKLQTENFLLREALEEAKGWNWLTEEETEAIPDSVYKKCNPVTLETAKVQAVLDAAKTFYEDDDWDSGCFNLIAAVRAMEE